MTTVTGYRDGKSFDLSVTYIGKDLKGRPSYLADDAALAFQRMASSAAADGVEIRWRTAFRDHGWQQRLWNEYQVALAAWKALPPEKRGDRPLRPCAPGWSRHEAGDAIDLVMRDERWIPLPCRAWLAVHAHEYGFSFPVEVEEWHAEHGPATLHS